MGLWRSIRKNAALLTVSSLVMQSLSMLWQVWLAAHIGAAGIGLFQLVGSVGFLFITLAESGNRERHPAACRRGGRTQAPRG